MLLGYVTADHVKKIQSEQYPDMSIYEVMDMALVALALLPDSKVKLIKPDSVLRYRIYLEDWHEKFGDRVSAKVKYEGKQITLKRYDFGGYVRARARSTELQIRLEKLAPSPLALYVREHFKLCNEDMILQFKINLY